MRYYSRLSSTVIKLVLLADRLFWLLFPRSWAATRPRAAQLARATLLSFAMAIVVSLVFSRGLQPTTSTPACACHHGEFVYTHECSDRTNQCCGYNCDPSGCLPLCFSTWPPGAPPIRQQIAQCKKRQDEAQAAQIMLCSQWWRRFKRNLMNWWHSVP